MIKTFEQFNENDPYSEEDWNEQPPNPISVEMWDNFTNDEKIKRR